MKIKLLLLVIITTALFKVPLLFAQDVFPKSDAIWVIHMYKYLGSPGEQFIYGLSGDTIINDLTYQKLYLLNDSTLNIDHQDIYVAGIRQINEQVWILPADNKDSLKFDEYLMYDFSKNVGEKIIFGKKPLWLIGGIDLAPTFENIDPTGLTIFEAEISEIEIREGRFFHIYSSAYYSDEIWLEGIGSLSGLFFFTPLRASTCCSGIVGVELICMKEKNEIKYKSDNCTSCFDTPLYTTGIDNILNDSNIYIYYDKKQDSIVIESKNTSSQIFNLYKLDGTSVFSSTILDANTFINTSNISKGIYFYNLIGSNFFKSGKLILK